MEFFQDIGQKERVLAIPIPIIKPRPRTSLTRGAAIAFKLSRK